MSTPVNQLPSSLPQKNHQEEDPIVNEVINEMEREFSNTRQQQMQQQQMQQQQMQMQQPQMQHQQMQQQQMQQQQMQQPQQQMQQPQFLFQKPKESLFSFNKTHAQYAIIASVAAFLLFYPCNTDLIYNRISYLQKLEPYDRVVRTILLIVLLYILLWKFNI